MDILAVAIHPNGYYVAASDKEMIRFFHLCYKELRYYNYELSQNEITHSDYHLLKFSFDRHILAAVSRRQLYIIKSYTRETLSILQKLKVFFSMIMNIMHILLVEMDKLLNIIYLILIVKKFLQK